MKVSTFVAAALFLILQGKGAHKVFKRRNEEWKEFSCGERNLDTIWLTLSWWNCLIPVCIFTKESFQGKAMHTSWILTVVQKGLQGWVRPLELLTCISRYKALWDSHVRFTVVKMHVLHAWHVRFPFGTFFCCSRLDNEARWPNFLLFLCLLCDLYLLSYNLNPGFHNETSHYRKWRT